MEKFTFESSCRDVWDFFVDVFGFGWFFFGLFCLALVIIWEREGLVITLQQWKQEA